MSKAKNLQGQIDAEALKSVIVLKQSLAADFEQFKSGISALQKLNVMNATTAQALLQVVQEVQ